MEVQQRNGLKDLFNGGVKELNLDAISIDNIFKININQNPLSKTDKGQVNEGEENIECKRRARLAINTCGDDLSLELSLNGTLVYPCTECKSVQSNEDFFSADEEVCNESLTPRKFKMSKIRDHGMGDCFENMLENESYLKCTRNVKDYFPRVNSVYSAYSLSCQMKEEGEEYSEHCLSTVELIQKDVQVQTDVVLGADSFSNSGSLGSAITIEEDTLANPSELKEEENSSQHSMFNNCESVVPSNFVNNLDNLNGLILKTQSNIINLQTLNYFNGFSVYDWWQKFNEMHPNGGSKDLNTFLDLLYQAYLSPVNFFLNMNGLYRNPGEAIECPEESGQFNSSKKLLQEAKPSVTKLPSLQDRLSSLSNYTRPKINSFRFDHSSKPTETFDHSFKTQNDVHRSKANSNIDYATPRTKYIREELNDFIARCLNEETNSEVRYKLRPTDTILSEKKRNTFRRHGLNGSHSLRYLKSGNIRKNLHPPIWSDPNDLI